jgi:hypothetical protein
MNDQVGHDVPAETAQAWDIVRRVREPLAWTLLVVAAVVVLVSAWQLVGLPGAAVHAPSGPVASVAGAPVRAAQGPVASVPSAPVAAAPAPVAGTTFAIRASVVAPQFVAGGLFLLPMLSVLLVAFAGGLLDRARQVVQAAISVQSVTLGLGLLSWVGALGAHLRPGVWFILDAADLAAMAAALIFGVAVLRSQALRTNATSP